MFASEGLERGGVIARLSGQAIAAVLDGASAYLTSRPLNTTRPAR